MTQAFDDFPEQHGCNDFCRFFELHDLRMPSPEIELQCHEADEEEPSDTEQAVPSTSRMQDGTKGAPIAVDEDEDSEGDMYC